MSEEQALVRKVRNAIARLIIEEPALGYFTKSLRIVLSNDIPTAGVDGVRIAINPGFVGKLGMRQLMGVLAHEAMHVAMLHPLRAGNLVRRGIDGLVVNVIADAVVNERIRNLVDSLEGAVYCKHISYALGIDENTCSEKSLEELVGMLVNRRGLVGLAGYGDRIMRDLNGAGSSHGEGQNSQGSQSGSSRQGGKEIVVNEGDEGLAEGATPGELERRVARKVIESYMVAKSIGRAPGWLERWVEQLLRPRVDWRAILRSWLQSGERVKRTWSRQNRKISVMPGKQYYGRSKAWVLVDVSGSIGEEELRQFISEVYGMLGTGAELVVVFWDTDVRKVVHLRRKDEIRNIGKIPGGGGTLIIPALRYVAERASSGDYVIILSDWVIGDLGNALPLMSRMGDRLIAVGIDREPPRQIRRRLVISR